MITLYLLASLASSGPAAAPPSTESPASAQASPGTAQPARAKANLASYVSDGDYPPEAIRSGQQGTVSFRLEVNAEGRVEKCEISGSSGSPALDEMTCRIMTERPRFEPARGRDGRPVADSVSSRIRWILPSGEDQPPLPTVRAASIEDLASLVRASDYPAEAVKDGQQGSSVVLLLVSPDGKAVDCRTLYPSGSTWLDDAACRILRERAHFTPARSADGSATWDGVPALIQWKLPAAR